ncbi:MAG: hypothetical protein QW493_04050, partial [Candidatus Bathyarchaeia archaeon]
KELADFVGRIIEEVNQIPSERKQRLIMVGQINEAQVLREAEGFLKDELNAEITIFEVSEAQLYDPKGKAHLARPGRPAIYIE